MVGGSTSLTPREREVLLLLARGCQYTQVAEVLVISPHTAASHARSIRLKLGASNAAHCVFIALVATSA